MQHLKCCAVISLLTILVMDAAAAPASSSKPSSSAGLPPIRRITDHSTSNNEFDEFWGHPDDNPLMNRGGFDGQQFEDDGNGLMEHGVLTDNGDVKTLEVIGSDNADILSRFGDDGTDPVVFNNEDDFAPESEPTNDEFVEPRMLLSPGEKINEDLKGPGYDWSVMGKVKKVTTQKPQEVNIHFAADEESDPKPWETNSKPNSSS